jgi:hypothetical protein
VGGMPPGVNTVSAGRQSLGNSKTPTVDGMRSAKCWEARQQSLWDRARPLSLTALATTGRRGTKRCLQVPPFDAGEAHQAHAAVL